MRRCPDCGQPLKRILRGEAGVNSRWECTNPDCPVMKVKYDFRGNVKRVLRAVSPIPDMNL